MFNNFIWFVTFSLDSFFIINFIHSLSLQTVLTLIKTTIQVKVLHLEPDWSISIKYTWSICSKMFPASVFLFMCLDSCSCCVHVYMLKLELSLSAVLWWCILRLIQRVDFQLKTEENLSSDQFVMRKQFVTHQMKWSQTLVVFLFYRSETETWVSEASYHLSESSQTRLTGSSTSWFLLLLVFLFWCFTNTDGRKYQHVFWMSEQTVRVAGPERWKIFIVISEND